MLKANKLFVVIVLLALVPLAANATISRLIGLGGPGSVMIVRDASETAIFPSRAVDNARQAGAEFFPIEHRFYAYDEYGYLDTAWTMNKWDNYGVYASWDFPNGSVVKLVLENTPFPKFNYTMTGWWIESDPRGELPPTNWDQYLDQVSRSDVSRLNATWAHPFSGMKLGAALRYEAKSYTQDKDEDHGIEEWDESYSAYGLTAGITAMEDKLDAAFNYDAGSFSGEYDGETEIESEGTREFGLVARYWAEMSDQYTLVPHFRYISHNLGWSCDTLDYSRSYSNFVLGVGNNWKPVDDLLVIFETGISLYSDTYEDPDKEYTNSMNDILYWRIGCETEVNNWLWGRVGAERAWRSSSYEFDPFYLYGFPSEGLEAYGNPTFGYSVTRTYVGATAHWRRLILDLVLEPEFFNAGPYFISGEGHNLTSRVSLKFDFNE